MMTFYVESIRVLALLKIFFIKFLSFYYNIINFSNFRTSTVLELSKTRTFVLINKDKNVNCLTLPFGVWQRKKNFSFLKVMIKLSFANSDSKTNRSRERIKRYFINCCRQLKRRGRWSNWESTTRSYFTTSYQIMWQCISSNEESKMM